MLNLMVLQCLTVLLKLFLHYMFRIFQVQDKRVFIQIWDIFCGACMQSMGELASIMRKGIHFLITNVNSFH